MHYSQLIKISLPDPGIQQAVNMVNGMIVDGLGHVSLDSGANATQNVPPNPSQANIHQGEGSVSYTNLDPISI